MIVVHTDASCKEGYSCWVYKSSINPKFKVGLVQTSNIAAVETLAAVKAIQDSPPGLPILIISDSLITVKIIQQHGRPWLYSDNGKDYYKKIRGQLINLLYNRSVDAIWIPSNNSNITHMEVDNMAKTVLQQFLKGVRL